MKILMICFGNICRSPLAEGVMRQLIEDENLDWEVASAATGDVCVGEPADPRSVAIAKQYGYDIANQRVRRLTLEMLDDYDYILTMDRHNFNEVTELAQTDQQRKKVSLFLKDDLEVFNPFFSDDAFERVFLQIEERVKSLLQELKLQNSDPVYRRS